MRRAYAFPATLTPEETAQLTMLYRAGAREARHATARCVIAGGPGELDPNLLEGLAARSLVRTLTAVTSMTLSNDSAFVGRGQDPARAIEVVERLWQYGLWGRDDLPS